MESYTPEKTSAEDAAREAERTIAFLANCAQERDGNEPSHPKRKGIAVFCAVLCALAVVAAGFAFLLQGTPAPQGTLEPQGTPGLVYAHDDFICTVVGYEGTSTSVTIPEYHNGHRVERIGAKAFERYTALTSITIPNSVTSIEKSAFSGCSGLTSVTIGNSVTSIGSDAFYDCTGLKEVHISDISAWCGISFEYLYANPLYYAENLYLNGNLVTELTIPDGVNGIGDYLFGGCTCLTSIVIPDSVTSIGMAAFDSCTGLTSVTIPDSVTSIGWAAFDGCTGLTSITIPDSVTSITWAAFDGCTRLTSVTFENATGWSADNALISSAALANTSTAAEYLTDTYCWYDWTRGNASGGTSTSPSTTNAPVTTSAPADTAAPVTTSPSVVPSEPSGSQGLEYEKLEDGTYEVVGIGTCTDTDIVIPAYHDGAKVTSIGSAAFMGCQSVTSVAIPDGVTVICYMAFYDCNNLMTVVIPASVESIQNHAFWSCDALALVTFPDSVTSIGGYAFAGCKGLTSVVLSDSVTSIGNYAFSYCTSLTSLTIPASVTSIGDFAFGGCTSLASVTFCNTIGWKANGQTFYSSYANTLADSAKAAKYLTDTYSNKTWTRE